MSSENTIVEQGEGAFSTDQLVNVGMLANKTLT